MAYTRDRIPFVVYAKITVEQGANKRFEIIRNREHLANLIYRDLIAATSINTVSPGGSGTWGLTSSHDSLSEDCPIVAVKPQFGQEPDIVTIVGFYNGNGVIPYQEKTVLHDGQYVSGPAGVKGSGLDPSSLSVVDVKALKAAIEAAVINVAIEIIKMDIAGVIYGHGGFHFPR